MTRYQVWELDDGRYSVGGWGPVFYTRDRATADMVCSAINSDEKVRRTVREIVDGADYEHVKHSMILSVCNRAGVFASC